MAVPLLDLKAQLSSIRDEVASAVLKVLDSTRYVMGPEVESLEQEVASFCGAQYGVGVSSGTDALLVSLMALEVGPGDLVVTTPYSFFATAGVVARLGATPVFVDIDPVSFNIDPAKLEEWFSQNKDQREKVKAILPVHLYGQCAEMRPISKIASQYGEIPVVEDAAQSIGASYPALEENPTAVTRAGSIGALGCFSFFPSKNLGGIGDGGMVVSSNLELIEKVRLLRNHGAKPKYYHSLIGGNFRLDPIQAAVVRVKLRYLPEWQKARQKNAGYYDRAFESSIVKTPKAMWGRESHVYNQYVIMVPERRDELRAYLQEKQIGSEVYYPVPFHLQECFQNLGGKVGDFAASEDAALRSVALPIYPELTQEMQQEVVSAVREFYEN